MTIDQVNQLPINVAAAKVMNEEGMEYDGLLPNLLELAINLDEMGRVSDEAASRDLMVLLGLDEHQTAAMFERMEKAHNFQSWEDARELSDILVDQGLSGDAGMYEMMKYSGLPNEAFGSL